MKRFLLALCFLCGCSKQAPITLEQKEKPSKKPLVVVSVSPYNTFVERIVGNTMDVQTLVPYGHNSHVFEPTAKQLAPLSRAKVFVGIGDHYEQKIYESVRTHSPYMVVVNLSEGHHVDEHYWMSPRKVVQQLAPITEAIIRANPKEKELYLKNLKTLSEELEKLQKVIAYKLKKLEGRAVVVSHAALGYYCADFDLIQLALEHHGKAPLPRQIKDLVAKAYEKEAICVFTQVGFDNRGAETVSKELDIPSYDLDPQNPDYFANMKKITLQITGNAESQ